jgi:demethylmenaquinone methyltransferase / 2-methoxy-6-polyprenyl-1,4-benzoquinol methylase
MPFPAASFDGAVSGFALRNVSDLDTLFSELARVLRPGGRVALLDVAAPTNPVLLAGQRVWFERIVPSIGALVSDAAAYRYLPQSLAYLPPPAALMDALRSAGFRAVEHRTLTGGLTQLFTATRAGTEP